MSFANSPGVYDRIVDRSYVVNAGGLISGGVVINSKRGPTDVNTVTSAREFIETYGLPDSDSPSMYAALRYLNRAGILSVCRVITDGDSAASGTLYGDCSEEIMYFDAASPGSWGNSVSVEFESHPSLSYPWFILVVKENEVEVERFEVSRDVGAKNGYGMNAYLVDVVNNRSKYIRVTDGQSMSFNFTSVVYLGNGTDAGAAPTEAEIILAWDKFKNVNAVPANLLINAGWGSQAIHTAMLAVAAHRKDAVAILDVPQNVNDDVTEMVAYRKTELAANTYFGGIYGGWIRIYDQYNDREVAIPPSGDVAAIFAHTVEVAERWDAPAGLQRGIIPNALGVTRVFDEGERDLLYSAGVNPITTIGGAAAVVWGQKTLQVQASALDRFNVVNLVLWMNQRIVESLQPFVFQPNTVFTRDSVNYLISNFLENIRLRGGLYGYSVDTSENINTPQVIDNNQMLVDVYIKPVRTAEYIRVSTIVTPTGVTLA